MTQQDIGRLITRFVDGELTEQTKIDELKDLIEKDKQLNFDYNVQVLVKKIVSERFAVKPIPVMIKNSLIRKINPSKKIFSFFKIRILF